MILRIAGFHEHSRLSDDPAVGTKGGSAAARARSSWLGVWEFINEGNRLAIQHSRKHVGADISDHSPDNLPVADDYLDEYFGATVRRRNETESASVDWGGDLERRSHAVLASGGVIQTCSKRQLGCFPWTVSGPRGTPMSCWAMKRFSYSGRLARRLDRLAPYFPSISSTESTLTTKQTRRTKPLY